MRKKIFISSSSKDRKAALTICSAIETRGFACWISSRDIRPGENFQEAIVDAISDAGLMVLVFSANANNSSEIKKEIALASQNQLTVIPVRIEDVLPNAALRYEFATRQWIDVFGDWEQSMQELLAQIALAFPPGEAAAAPVVREPPRPATPQQAVRPAMGTVSAKPEGKFAFARKPYAIGGAALVLLLIAGGAFIFLRSPPQAPQNSGPVAQTAPQSKPQTASAANAPVESAQSELDQGNAAFNRKNYGDAMQWWQKAAAQGNADAEFNIATLYYEGQGVTKDYGQARQWDEKAASHGSAQAALNTGKFYELGQGVTKDTGQAMQWYQKAVALGDAGAQAALDRLKAAQTAPPPQGAPAAKDESAQTEQERGNDAFKRKDFGQAMQWYQKAAAQGDSISQFTIGLLYQNGLGVTKDYGQAMQWYKKAAAQGNGEADDFIGTFYESGVEVPKDSGQAIQWYQKALSDGWSPAQQQIDKLKATQAALQPQGAPAAGTQNQPAAQLQASLQPATPGASSRPGVVFGCTEPPAPTPVNGAKLDRDQMVAAATEVKNYMSRVDVFQQCVNSFVTAQKALAAAKNQTLDQSITAAAGDAVSANQARKQQAGDEVNQAIDVYRSTHS